MKEPGEQTNILLVDDEINNLTVLEVVLADLGQRLVKARSGKEALKKVMSEEFAVILLDVQMPEMNGYEVAGLIRERRQSRSTPIIFLTALSTSDVHLAQGYASGAVDYLVKPFDPTILKAKVAVFVEMAKNTKRLETEIKRREEAEAKVKRLNTELERRVQERTARIETLNAQLEKMLAETHHRVKNNLQILTAIVEMQRTDARSPRQHNGWDRLGMHIHTLAVVHELLTEQTEEDTRRAFLPLQPLFLEVMDFFQQRASARKLTSSVDAVHFPIREGTTLALIANELSSNALHYGKGTVEVIFTVQARNAKLEVCDHGPGFPSGFHPKQAAYTGLLLVENLSRHDLNGEVRYENRDEGGARVSVTMPLPKGTAHHEH